MDPARVGPNELHLYVLRASDGTPFDGTKELTVTLALPAKGIGPLPATAREAGPGHYVVDTVQVVPAATGACMSRAASRSSTSTTRRSRCRCADASLSLKKEPDHDPHAPSQP